MDGAVVLEKDAHLFERQWEEFEKTRVDREENKRVGRIHEHWKKFIKGILRLDYVRKKFKTEKPAENNSILEEPKPREIIENTGQINPLTGFSLDDFINNKSSN
uniref:Uncharacterized protein n=1 Tax=Caenorhabditis japonica TaxID=281687 RepID=A0A8R1E8R7_CAEJA